MEEYLYSSPLGEFCDIKHIFVEYGRLVVGEGDSRTVILNGQFHDSLWGEVIVECLVDIPLGHMPIMAELAPEVTTGGSDA